MEETHKMTLKEIRVKIESLGFGTQIFTRRSP
jgi:hypothetical protein